MTIRTKSKGLYNGPQKRRSARFDKNFQVKLEYEGTIHEVRSIDISHNGVLIPRRLPPPIGTAVMLTLNIRGETASFKGIVARHTKHIVNGTQTMAIGIDFQTAEYEEFVRDKIFVS